MYHYCDGTTVQHYVLKIDICLLGGRNSIHLKRNLIQVQKPLIYFNDAETFSAFCSSLMNLGGLTHERSEFAQRRQDFKISSSLKNPLIYFNDT